MTSQKTRSKSRSKTVFLLVGTKKGGFVFTASPNRKTWSMSGPHFKGNEVHHMALDTCDGMNLFAASGNAWFGYRLYRSHNLGKKWETSDKGLEFPQDIKARPSVLQMPGDERTVERTPLKLTRIWRIEPSTEADAGVLYVGVDPAGLFKSTDGGASWEVVKGLTYHETRDRWNPGAGGMMVHSIQIDSKNPKRLYAGISAAGAFVSDDGGETWAPRNKNVRTDYQPEKFPEVGQCVHHLVAHPRRPGVLFQQNHCGVYSSKDAGANWKDISRGLPSRFGFSMIAAPNEEETIFVVPQEADTYRIASEGRLGVYRSRDGGKSWALLKKGLPQKNVFTTVLREAGVADSCDPGGVYIGTASGQIFCSRDLGNSWEVLAGWLPPVYSLNIAIA